MRRYLIAALCSSLLLTAAAEDIRVKVAANLSLGGQAAEGQKAVLVYSDGAGIHLPEDLSFIEGVELELRVPPAVQSAKGSFIFFVYKRLSPAPDPRQVSYSGEKLVMAVVPSRVAQVYQIPLRKSTPLKGSPYTILLPVAGPEDFPLLFRLMPAMKGLPDELETAQFQLRAKPVYADLGRVRISFKWAEGLDQSSPLTVLVDDVELKDPRESFMLKPGNHSLRVTGPNVRDEFRAFTVSQARNHEIAVELEDVTPRLVLEFPEKTRIELDGKGLAGKEAKEPIALTPGEHVIGFFVGDYAIQRRLQVQRGKTYRVSLLVDVKVEEED